MYDELHVQRLPKDDELVSKARCAIINEIRSNGSDSDQHMADWYIDKRWLTKNVAFCHLVKLNDDIVSLSGNTIEPDNTMKILCNFYVMPSYRSKYKSLHQVRLIPECVNYAREFGMVGIWYSIHCFDKRHERYSESQKRLVNGGRVGDNHAPYRKSFNYVGKISYRGVMQDKFYMDIRTNDSIK